MNLILGGCFAYPLDFTNFPGDHPRDPREVPTIRFRMRKWGTFSNSVPRRSLYVLIKFRFKPAIPHQRQIRIPHNTKIQKYKNTKYKHVDQVWLQPARPPLRSQPCHYLESAAFSTGFFRGSFLEVFKTVYIPHANWNPLPLRECFKSWPSTP